ncbi:LCP family protein [Clostridium perfringens]|uniref:Cell envelope-related transcriptional attenuator domain protein n=1 Tax=Clostridium perfringens E str. JGS1987 TaxID=451755 RepID=B1BQ12_CLOPF|nr:LCP family protein [Clostridium perfringens]EDT16354.1 cell envelope-related transcriptional attenuator domain protein [Clostridium perfringens E str. JGS1987]EJT6558534.1 LCP family protein [Clostridium perfringens]ELC8458217.1 LCP family protein [Clostridium perfringens]MCX0375193.1 LCP family protein [Clostridium perfringens]MCX0403245.1 LCP family protein [Clostridium perfringens]
MDKKKHFNFSKKQKITIFSLLAILILIASVVGFFVFRFYNHSYEGNTDPAKVNTVDEDIKFKEVPGITNILLLSSDARPGEDVSRSDSIMILTIDNINKKLKVTSLMRDMLVKIDGHGEEKLNHAFAYGGPTKTIETIQNNFGIKLNNYVIVDFSAFVKVIDAINGIEVTVKDYELDELNKYILDGGGSEEDLLPSPGTYNLNGYQALSYARIRKVGNGEYERTERQRAVLQIALEKVKDMSTVKLVSLLNELFPYVKTNISLGNAMDYGFTALNVGKKCNFEIEQFRVPLDSISKGGIINNKGWVFVIDKVETSKALQEFIFNDNKNYEPDTSNFDSIIEQYFNDYDIKDDTTHPDYEYVPSINTNGNFEKPKNNSGNSSNNNSSNNKVEKPSNQGNSVNSSNKPSSGSTSTGNNSTEKPNTSEKPSIPQETPAEKPSENNGSSGNGESSNTQSNNGNTSSENSNNQNNTEEN